VTVTTVGYGDISPTTTEGRRYCPRHTGRSDSDPASYGALASMSGVVSSVCGPFSVHTAYVDRYIETPAYSPLTLKA